MASQDRRHTQFNLSALLPDSDKNVTKPTKGERRFPLDRNPGKIMKRRPTTSITVDVDPSTGLKSLHTVEALKAGFRPYTFVKIRDGSPKQLYYKVFKIMLDSWVQVAYQKCSPRKLVIVKKFSGEDAIDMVSMLQKIRHENIVTFLDCFNYEGCHHVMLDYMNITAHHFTLCDVYPNESQLAAIIGQASVGYNLRLSRH
jgi:serine/threonine protein kinase